MDTATVETERTTRAQQEDVESLGAVNSRRDYDDGYDSPGSSVCESYVDQSLCCKRVFRAIEIHLVSLVFCGYFVYTAIHEDVFFADRIAFVIINATVPIVYSIYFWWTSFPIYGLYFISSIMAGWSIAYLARNLSSPPGGTDNDVFYVAVWLGLVSSIWHAFLATCIGRYSIE